MFELSEQEIQLLSQQYQQHYHPDVSDRLARKLAASLDPRLGESVRLWLATGQEQPFAFTYGGYVYSLLSVQRTLGCNYLTAVELMNEFVSDPERNYYRIIPC